jgi:hypothetical protein
MVEKAKKQRNGEGWPAKFGGKAYLFKNIDDEFTADETI